MIRFRNREEAGHKLALGLRSYASEHPIVLALPRGGIPIGFEVARFLSAPLDVLVVRKLGVPWQPELGVGAVAEGGFVHLDSDILGHVGLSQPELAELTETKRREVDERVQRFRGARPAPDLRGQTVILVDDGIATGGTVHAAIQSIRSQHPKKIILAVPVAASDTIEALNAEVDDLVCLVAPPYLHAIGLWYQDFSQVADHQALALLDRARREHANEEHEVA